ncbi:MAG: Ig-like domain-containing protein, partial [Bacteroidota bacterium]
GVTFNNAGTVEARSGTLSLSNYSQTGGAIILVGGNITSGTTLNIQGGILTGVGTVTANVLNAGRVSVGLSPGTLAISGSYSQTSTGVLDIEIGGLSAGLFDKLTISGSATLAGTLNITLINGFVPSAGDSLQVMTFGSRSGFFTTINGLGIGNYLSFVPNYSSTNLSLTSRLPTISLTSGNNQTGPINTRLIDSLVVTVRDGGGNPVPGVNVTFAIDSIPSGATGQSLSVASASTNIDGQASTVLSFGNKIGTYTVTATLPALSGSQVTFVARAIPPTYPATLSLNTTVNFPSLPQASNYKPTDYRIVGLPGASDTLISKLLNGAQGVDWQVFWDNGAASNYLEKYDGGPTFRFSVGRAFWVIKKGSWTVNTTVPSAPVDSIQVVALPLHSGWNLITNPFTSSILWSKIQTVNGIAEPIYSYDGSFPTSVAFQPYVGY